MDYSAYSPSFPITNRSASRLKSIAKERSLRPEEVIQEARLVEWSLKDIEYDGDAAGYKYFWKALYCRLVEMSCPSNTGEWYRTRKYKRVTESGDVEKSDEPFYEGQRRTLIRTRRQILSLNDLMDAHSDLMGSEDSLIDSHSFDSLFITDMIKAYVDLVTQYAEHSQSDRSSWKTSLDILNARIEDGISWEDIPALFPALTPVTVRRHKCRLEKVFRLLVELTGSTRARITPDVSPSVCPVSVGYRASRVRASFLSESAIR